MPTKVYSSEKYQPILPVSSGGTGASSPATARENLGITPANIGASPTGHGHALTDTVITGTLAIGKGGTGATTAAAALTALGAAPATHNHDASNITSGTLPVARGGTGASAKSAILLSNIGIYYAATLAAGTTDYPPASNTGCLLIVPAS